MDDPALLGAFEADEGEDGQAEDDEACHELMLRGETLEWAVAGELRVLAEIVSAVLAVSMVSLRGTKVFVASTLLALASRTLN